MRDRPALSAPGSTRLLLMCELRLPCRVGHPCQAGSLWRAGRVWRVSKLCRVGKLCQVGNLCRAVCPWRQVCWCSWLCRFLRYVDNTYLTTAGRSRSICGRTPACGHRRWYRKICWTTFTLFMHLLWWSRMTRRVGTRRYPCPQCETAMTTPAVPLNRGNDSRLELPPLTLNSFPNLCHWNILTLMMDICGHCCGDGVNVTFPTSAWRNHGHWSDGPCADPRPWNVCGADPCPSRSWTCPRTLTGIRPVTELRWNGSLWLACRTWTDHCTTSRNLTSYSSSLAVPRFLPERGFQHCRVSLPATFFDAAAAFLLSFWDFSCGSQFSGSHDSHVCICHIPLPLVNQIHTFHSWSMGIYLENWTIRMDTNRGPIWSWSVLGMDDKAPAHQHPQYWLNILCIQQV